MFSYRHGFHAGNHADVFKHICQMLILQKLSIKPKPWTYIDTHSGAGLYDLTSDESNKTLEYQQGIGRLMSYKGDCDAIIAYQDIVNNFLRVEQYPGSPQIAAHLARQDDKLICMEWHNSEIKHLKHNMYSTSAAIHHRDGYEGLLAVSPPKPNRGLVLVDPPYELANEYSQVVNTISKVLKKWATGVFAIWYPLLGERAGKKQDLSQQMVQELSMLPVKSLLMAELEVNSIESNPGMYGSGLAIINAPYQLDSDLNTCLRQLHPILREDSNAQYRIKWLVS